MNLSSFVKCLTASAILLGSLAACGPGQGGADTAAQATAPASTTSSAQKVVSEYKGGPADLLVLDVNAGFKNAPDTFQRIFVDPLQAKYPQIKLTMAKDNLNNLLAAGTPPDLVLVSNASLTTVIETALPEDLTPVIKSFNLPVSQFEPTVVSQVKLLSDNKIYGLPFAMNYGAMLYNRDIFDKFGVPYPKDVMNYDEAYELARKLTRTEGGTNYLGAIWPDLRQLYWQYGVPVFDKASGKAKLTTDKHTKVLTMLQKFYAIPGYVQKNVYQPSPDTFFKDQRTAMYMNWIGAFYSYFKAAGTKDNFKWDLTAHPGYPDRPGLGKEVDFHMVVVNQSSKYREAAYQLLKILSSDDVQTIISRAGRLPVVKNDAIRGQFGADNDMFKGKNLQAIFKVTPSPLPEASKYDVEINKLLTKDVSKSVVAGEDVNTALRKAEEKANKEIVVE